MMPLPTKTGTCPAANLEAICAGDAWEMGFAQGRSLKAKIHKALTVLTELEAFRLQKPRLMPFAVFRRVAELKAKKFLAGGLANVLPAAQVRLLGLAEGADVRPNSLYLLNAMEAVLADLSQCSVSPIAAACSALAVTGSASSTRQPILAHNFDYLPAIQPLYTVRESRPAGTLRSLEFTAAPLCGTIDGINEAGLCISYNYAHTIDGQQPGPTISMWISEALSRCRNVSQAAELFANSRRWGGGLLMLGDADGQIASLELSSTRSALRLPQNSQERLFHTNRFQNGTMISVEIDEKAVYTNRAPRVLRNRRVHQSADERDRRFRARLAGATQLDPKQIVELMSDHGPEDEPSADSICMHSDYWHTTACLQLYPKERRMRVAYGAACRAGFVDFAL